MSKNLAGTRNRVFTNSKIDPIVHPIAVKMMIKLVGLCLLAALYFRDIWYTLPKAKVPSGVHSPPVADDLVHEASVSSEPKAEFETAEFESLDPFVPGISNLERTIEFSVCTSCGFRKRAESQAAIIQSVYPSLQPRIINYVPSLPWRMLSMALTALTMTSLLYAFAGEKLLKVLNMREPSIITKLKENKLYVMGYFLLLNMASSSVSSSGAYEVSLDNLLLFSKIHSGTFPTDDQLLASISEHV